MTDPDEVELIPAATVLLLRDGDSGDGIEVLMVHRNSKIAFGGMWVFPGGKVDPEERIPDDPLGSARTAAVREVREETGLTVVDDQLVTWSQWIPPEAAAMPVKGKRRRFSTWFFATKAPAGEIAIDHGEIHDDAWMTPAEAHRRHQAGEIEIVPPTWVTLWQLARHNTVDEALDWARTNEPRLFVTKAIGRDPLVLAWAGDCDYDEESTGRHRIVLDPDRWAYEFDPA